MCFLRALAFFGTPPREVDEMTGRRAHKILLIVRRPRLEERIVRCNTESQARFSVEHLGTGFSYLAADRR
jgi:hypothetical protein